MISQKLSSVAAKATVVTHLAVKHICFLYKKSIVKVLYEHKEIDLEEECFNYTFSNCNIFNDITGNKKNNVWTNRCNKYNLYI